MAKSCHRTGIDGHDFYFNDNFPFPVAFRHQTEDTCCNFQKKIPDSRIAIGDQVFIYGSSFTDRKFKTVAVQGTPSRNKRPHASFSCAYLGQGRQAPGKGFGTALIRMLEVIAFIPFESCFQSFERIQILIVAADAVFDGGHDGIAGPPFAIAEAEVDAFVSGRSCRA